MVILLLFAIAIALLFGEDALQVLFGLFSLALLASAGIIVIGALAVLLS